MSRQSRTKRIKFFGRFKRTPTSEPHHEYHEKFSASNYSNLLPMMIERHVEKEKPAEKLMENHQDSRPTSISSLDQIWQKRCEKIGEKPSHQQIDKNLPYSQPKSLLSNHSPTPPRPKSELAQRPSISLTDASIALQGESGSSGRRFTIKYDDTEYIVDIGASQSNIISSQGGEGEDKSNQLKNNNINYRFYRRSNSVAGNNASLPQRFNKPKMSVVGRMASIFVSDVVDKQTLQQQGKKQRPTSLGALGRSTNKIPEFWTERGSGTDDSIPTIERDNSNNVKEYGADGLEEQHKRFCEMAFEAVNKLRYILHQLNSGQLPLEDLKRNIEYAALVLETAYMDETRRICDEDDDLAEVTPEAVPEEVREWLAATFTRQAVQPKREKPKFKSVANAIRTGIFFEKIFRRTQIVLAPIPNEYKGYLRNVNNWNFNSFELDEFTGGHALKYVGFELFNRYGFLERFKINIQVLEHFLLALEVGYSKHNNPYHNCVHAADVTQTSHWILSQTGLASTLTDLELLAVLFGALIHDYEHTGHTNNFHIQSGSNFALVYNDRSVLENYHASSVFRLMKDEEKNIFERLTRDEFRDIRNMIIEIVLATDMSTHFVQIKTMKNMLTLPEGIDKMKALCLIVHACDISHASKPWDLHYRWTEGVLEEFFRQGDLEASMGLPYSPLCDRHTTHVAESQIGFIDFIVEPTMVVCGEMLTKMVEPLVSLPSSDSLFPPGQNAADGDGSASATSLSPLPPDLKSPSPGNPVSVRKIPINYFGKLEIPSPWIRHLQENKTTWRERAVNEEAERNRAQQEKLTNGHINSATENGDEEN